MKTISLVVGVLLLTGCGMYNKNVRDSYADKKIAFPLSMENPEKASKSTFKNFLTLKISRSCDFDLLHFKSLSYHYQGQYSSTDVDIYSTLITPKDLYVALANVMPDYLQKASDGSYIVRSYLLSKDETLLTKDLCCEIRLNKQNLATGTYDKSMVEVTIKNKNGGLLFDSKQADAEIAFTIKEISNNLLFAQLSGKSVINGTPYTIHDGNLWVKL
jgi:hypothetical protein